MIVSRCIPTITVMLKNSEILYWKSKNILVLHSFLLCLPDSIYIWLSGIWKWFYLLAVSEVYIFLEINVVHSPRQKSKFHIQSCICDILPMNLCSHFFFCRNKFLQVFCILDWFFYFSSAERTNTPARQPKTSYLSLHWMLWSSLSAGGVWMQVSLRGMSSDAPIQTERRDRDRSSFKNVAPQSLWEQIMLQKSKSTFNISNTCMIFVSGFHLSLHVLNISKLRWIWNACWHSQHGWSVSDPVVVSTGMQILSTPFPVVPRWGSHSAWHALEHTRLVCLLLRDEFKVVQV